MSNVLDARGKSTMITLNDGVERDIKYTLNAMAEMEDRYGSVEKAFEALEGNSIKAVRFMLWAGLMHHGLTEQQVGEMIDIKCMESIMQSVGAALTNDMPAEGEQLPNEQMKAVAVPLQSL